MDASSPDSFVNVEEWLRRHLELKKAGAAMHQAFVTLARTVWERSGGEIKPRKAGEVEKQVPFSRGTPRNLADTRVRRGAITLFLKIPPETLPSVDPDLRTVPIKKKGRFAPYPRAFDFRDPEDIAFAAQLILACTSRPKPRQHVPPARVELELDFHFVRDVNLKKVLRSDWQESRRVYDAGAWKTYVIICGGLVEGLLVDALGRDPDAARRHYMPRPGEIRATPLSRWPFDALVRIARQMGLLSFDMAARCQTLRSRRNLVHPAHAATIRLDVTDEDALGARATLHDCYAELQRRPPSSRTP